jgi:peptide/nickel transport system substrate-binding protein
MRRKHVFKAVLAGAIWFAGAAMAAPSETLTVVVPNFGRELLDLGKTSTQDLQYTGHIHEPLIGTAPDGTLAPERGLAQSWTISDDAKTYTLKLREGVKWHDGKPFTSDDVVFSLTERFMAKDAICTFCRLLQSIESVEAADPTTVVIKLKTPDPLYLAILSARDGDIRMLARHNYRATPEGFDMVGDPIGTGPWKYASFSRGVEMTLSANTDYWDKERIPEFSTLRIVPRSQPSTRLSMIRSGEADMAFVDPRQADDARAAGLRVLAADGAAIASLEFYGCWQEEMLCHKQDFREAMVRAIDMPTIFKHIYPEGTARSISSAYWPVEQSIGFDPDQKPYAYDPKRSAELLKKVGYKGTTVKIWSVRTVSIPEAPEIMELVDGYLRAAGFKTEVTPMEFGAFRPRYASTPQRWETQYAAHLYLNAPGVRPTVLPNLRVGVIGQSVGGLIQGYWDLPTIDEQWKKLITLHKPDDLKAELLGLNKKMHAEFVNHPLAMKSQVAVVGKQVASWTPSLYGFAWHLETVKKQK